MWELLTLGLPILAFGFARGAQAGWENAVDDILGGRVTKEDIR